MTVTLIISLGLSLLYAVHSNLAMGYLPDANILMSSFIFKTHSFGKSTVSCSKVVKMMASVSGDGSKPTLKNLKTVPGQAGQRTSAAALSTWKELQGLSEKELFQMPIEDTDRSEKALNLAYRRCEYVTQLFSKTFYMGTSLMRPDARKHVWAIYTWCRRTDDLVDSPRACLLNRDTLTADLDNWTSRLDEVWEGKPVDLFDLAMADTVKAYPDMSIEPYRDMIKGMIMDVPGLGQERYKDFEELYLYCYRVAATVGLMTLPVLGCNPKFTYEEAKEPAIALGIALQLTNILRDVGEDLERGRIYLPQDEIAAFGLTEEDIFRCEVTPKYKDFMKFQISRARDYYKVAQEGIPMLAKDGRFAVQASLDLYSRILDVIERNDYDNFRCRAYTTKLEKLSILPKSWLTSQRAH